MEHLERLMKRYPMLAGMREEIELVFYIMKDSYEKGGKLLVCGNGGSAADSDHIVGELMKGFYKQRKLPAAEKIRFGEQGEKLQGALPAIALSQHSALSTAFLNDVDPEMVFAQQVYGYGAEDVVFLWLSTAGNSVNVISAAKVAAAKGMKVIAMTGKDGGAMRELSDVCLVVPAQMTADIQEFHLPIYHALCAMLEDYFFPGE